MVGAGARTRSQTSVSRKEMKLANASDDHKEKIRDDTVPLVRLKNYKVKARSCNIKLDGSIEKQLRSIFKKCSGHGHAGGRNTRERIRGMKNLVNNGIFVIVNENKLELQKRVKLTYVPSSDFEIRDTTPASPSGKSKKLTFVPSSDFEIRDITSACSSANSKKMDSNNNSFVVSKNQPEDIPKAGCSDDVDYNPRKIPKWSREPALSRSLRSQQRISPDTIFAEQASIRPEDLAQMFPQSAQGRDLWNSPPRAVNNVANISIEQ